GVHTERPAGSLRPRPGIQYSQTDEQQTRNGIQVPRGKVKFYDAEKGFGFILDDEDGQSVYVHATNLPDGVTTLRPGTRVDFDMVDGRRGPQVLSLQPLDPAPSVRRARRQTPAAPAPRGPSSMRSRPRPSSSPARRCSRSPSRDRSVSTSASRPSENAWSATSSSARCPATAAGPGWRCSPAPRAPRPPRSPRR